MSAIVDRRGSCFRRTSRSRFWPHLLSIGLMAGLLSGCDGAAPEDESEVERPAVADAARLPSLAPEPLAADASLREMLQHPDALERATRVARFLRDAEPDDLEDLRYAFETAALDAGDIEYALFGHWWARFDPEAAYEFADSQIRMEQPRVVSEILRTWARIDPQGLVESRVIERSGLLMPGFGPGLYDPAVVGWFQSGEPGLSDFILAIQDSEARAIALKAWVRMRVLRDGDVTTLEWTQSAPYHASIKRQLLAGALSIIAHQNPKLAIQWLDKAEADGIDVGTFMARVANAWAHHEPRAALDWVLSFSDGPERFRAIRRVAQKWTRRDPQGMLEWVAKHAETGDRVALATIARRGIQAFVEQNDYRVDWPDLMTRASILGKTNERDIVMKWVLQRWYVADPADARAWAEQNVYELPGPVLEGATRLPDAEREKVEVALGRSSAEG